MRSNKKNANKVIRHCAVPHNVTCVRALKLTHRYKYKGLISTRLTNLDIYLKVMMRRSASMHGVGGGGGGGGGCGSKVTSGEELSRRRSHEAETPLRHPKVGVRVENRILKTIV